MVVAMVGTYSYNKAGSQAQSRRGRCIEAKQESQLGHWAQR
jgi:hypothetical protein